MAIKALDYAQAGRIYTFPSYTIPIVTVETAKYLEPIDMTNVAFSQFKVTLRDYPHPYDIFAGVFGSFDGENYTSLPDAGNTQISWTFRSIFGSPAQIRTFWFHRHVPFIGFGMSISANQSAEAVFDIQAYFSDVRI